MRSAHWILFAAGALGAIAAFVATREPNAPVVLAGGCVFLAAAIAQWGIDLRARKVPPFAPRGLAWIFTVLSASFAPMLFATGTWGRDVDSYFMYPSVFGGVMLAPFATPWLCSVGPQPSWQDGRATPILYAWLSLVLAYGATG